MKLIFFLLISFSLLFSLSRYEISNKIKSMSFEEYKAYKKTDEYKYGTSNAKVNKEQSNFSYIVRKKDIQLKGGNVRTGTPPKYNFLLLELDMYGNYMNKKNIKNLLSKALSLAKKENNVDAITIWLYKESTDWRVGEVEWWPKKHSLSIKNYKNIQDKNTYITNYRINPPQKINIKYIVNRLPITKRKEIYIALVNSEKKARKEGNIKFAYQISNYDFSLVDKYVVKLEDKYRKQLLTKYKISNNELSRIVTEAFALMWSKK